MQEEVSFPLPPLADGDDDDVAVGPHLCPRNVSKLGETTMTSEGQLSRH